jgi:tRNA(Ile)-lysidine synthase
MSPRENGKTPAADKAGRIDAVSPQEIVKSRAAAKFKDFNTSLPLAIGVSGGSDSMALLRLCADLFGPSKIVALTVDHGMRPDSNAEAQQVSEWCKTWGVRQQTLPWKGEKPKSNIQQAARAARYAILLDWCRKNQIDNLAVAHTKDDQAETFMMRLARGSGVDGLSGMDAVVTRDGLRILRPLLQTTRDELRDYLRSLGQTWVEDPSNQDPRFGRTRMRALRTNLEKEGLTPDRLVATASHMSRVRRALEAATNELEKSAVSCDEAGFCVIDAVEIADAPDEIGLRLLARLCRRIGGAAYPPRFDRLERLYASIVSQGEVSGRTLSGCRFADCPNALRRGDAAQILISRENASQNQALMALTPGGMAIWDNRFEVSLSASGLLKGQPATREYGVKPLGVEGWRQIKTMVKAPLPAVIRQGLPAFWSGNSVACAPHLGYTQHGIVKEGAFTATFLG